MKMNEKQRAVMGTVAIALLVAALFYIPWTVAATGELRWAPFYRNPVVQQRVAMGESTDSRFIRLKGQRAYGVYALQLLVIGAIGAFAYRAAEDKPG
jgi:hypothetical protein